jgi:hypothetical protein
LIAWSSRAQSNHPASHRHAEVGPLTGAQRLRTRPGGQVLPEALDNEAKRSHAVCAYPAGLVPRVEPDLRRAPPVGGERVSGAKRTRVGAAEPVRPHQQPRRAAFRSPAVCVQVPWCGPASNASSARGLLLFVARSLVTQPAGLTGPARCTHRQTRSRPWGRDRVEERDLYGRKSTSDLLISAYRHPVKTQVLWA